MSDNSSLQQFFSLLRAGLWEQSAGIVPEEPMDFKALYELAEEQAVTGLVAAGLEHLEGRKVKKAEGRDFLETILYLENRNTDMDVFIGELFRRLNAEGIYALLVKGQGIAQCYERPLWRMSGDIDLLLDVGNYQKAKAALRPFAERVDKEDEDRLHLGMRIEPWRVELHGTLRTGLPARVNEVVDKAQRDTMDGDVRIWRNGDIDIPLPGPTNDVVFVFTHILNHFFRGGIGLRQICDWCRLLWTYRDALDRERLEGLVGQADLVTEWKAFAAYVVEYLGVPVEAMPLYDAALRWRWKARRINAFVVEMGNMGHKRDKGYFNKYPYLVHKAISLCYRTRDFLKHLVIFPRHSLNIFHRVLINGTKVMMKGE